MNIIVGLMAALSLLHSPGPYSPATGVTRAQRTHAVPGPCGGWRALVDRYEWNVEDACRVHGRRACDVDSGLSHY